MEKHCAVTEADRQLFEGVFRSRGSGFKDTPRGNCVYHWETQNYRSYRSFESVAKNMGSNLMLIFSMF